MSCWYCEEIVTTCKLFLQPRLHSVAHNTSTFCSFHKGKQALFNFYMLDGHFCDWLHIIYSLPFSVKCENVTSLVYISLKKHSLFYVNFSMSMRSRQQHGKLIHRNLFVSPHHSYKSAADDMKGRHIIITLLCPTSHPQHRADTAKRWAADRLQVNKRERK